MKITLEEKDIKQGLLCYSKSVGYVLVTESNQFKGIFICYLNSGSLTRFNTTGEVEMFLNGHSIKPVINQVTLSDIL